MRPFIMITRGNGRLSRVEFMATSKRLERFPPVLLGASDALPCKHRHGFLTYLGGRFSGPRRPITFSHDSADFRTGAGHIANDRPSMEDGRVGSTYLKLLLSQASDRLLSYTSSLESLFPLTRGTADPRGLANL